MSNYYATEQSVGEWNGQEALAAQQFNRIVDAFAVQIDDPDRLADLIHYAWDDWGSEPNLLTINDRDISRYVQSKT